MDDWFNAHGNSEKNKDDRKVGRIFHEDNFDSTFDFQNVNDNINDSFERTDLSKPQQEFDAFDSILNSGNQPEFSEHFDFENFGSETQMKVNETKTEMSFEDISSSKVKKIKKGRSRGKKVVISIISILLVLVMVLGGYVYKIIGSLNYVPETHTDNAYISDSDLYSSDDVINILILGTDKRESQANYRSDTMMLLSIDKKNKALKLTSFLRDSWVYIPAKDQYAKLNAACAYGGAQMVIDTIEYNYKVKIDNYVMVDFDIFKTIVNGIGGIKLKITKAEAECISKEGGYKCTPGTHRVQGRTALWYARIRHLDSDFNRTERQRKVIAAIIKQVKKCSIPTLLSTLESVLPEIQTDINKTQLITLGVGALMSYMNYDMVEQQIPAKGTWWNATVSGQAVLKFDSDENIDILKEYIYDKSVEDIKGESEK